MRSHGQMNMMRTNEIDPDFHSTSVSLSRPFTDHKSTFQSTQKAVQVFLAMDYWKCEWGLGLWPVDTVSAKRKKHEVDASMNINIDCQSKLI